ncbi:MAG: hypothetical protein IKZ05_06165 [Clostridia bacterium]|nr:hypothetical protein [Clostridia bacterium]
MNILAVCGFGIASAIAVAIIRRLRPELAEPASAVSAVILFVYVIKTVAPFVSLVRDIAEDVGVTDYFALMLKALAISLCCRLSSEICRSCGEAAIGAYIELAGKAGIVLVTLPVIQQLLEIAKDMLK